MWNECRMAASLTINMSRSLREISFLLRSSGVQQCAATARRSVSFFSRKKPENTADAEDEMEPHVSMKEGLHTTLKRAGTVVTRKGYQPPADVESRAERITQNICGEQADWQDLSLQDANLKYKVLTKLMKEFNHTITNFQMSDIKTVQDAVNHFKTEVRDTSTYEDISKLDLPKNLHINLEAQRYDPERDGPTAFPLRDTVIHSLKYKKIYKGFKAPRKEFEIE